MSDGQSSLRLTVGTDILQQITNYISLQLNQPVAPISFMHRIQLFYRSESSVLFCRVLFLALSCIACSGVTPILHSNSRD